MLEELEIRPAGAADADAVRAIYAPMVQETAKSFEETPPGAPEIERRMLARPRLPWLVAAYADHVVGFAYAAAHRHRPAYRWAADSSVYVAASHQGRGVGRMLYERLVEEVRALGYVTLCAGIALPNEASVALHRGLGFEVVGVYRNVGFKHGTWRDVGWWQRQLTEPPTSPAEPREWNPGNVL